MTEGLPQSVTVFIYIMPQNCAIFCYRLKTISTMQLKEAITCLTITTNNSHLLIGLRDGKLIVTGNKRTAQAK